MEGVVVVFSRFLEVPVETGVARDRRRGGVCS
jgi:hypothetical protein